MTNESKSAGTRKFRLTATVLAVVAALLAVEAFYYFSAPPLDDEQKMLRAWENVPAPDFVVTNINGERVHLADLKGRRVILNFWATWCAPCLEELPDFIKLRAEISTNDLAIIGLSTDDDETLQTFVKRNGVNYQVAQLKNIPSPYQDVEHIPVTMVIDRNGVIQHVVFSAQSYNALKKFATEPDFSGTAKSAPDAPK